MQFLVYLALVPCLVAANAVSCPDSSTCPEGTTCCANPSGTYECCDVGGKRLIPGMPTNSMNATLEKRFNACGVCYGTCCFAGCCHEHVGATCCTDYESCCPGGSQCCRTAYSSKAEWCCPNRGSCAATKGYCYGGAGSLIPAISIIAGLVSLLVLRGKSIF